MIFALVIGAVLVAISAVLAVLKALPLSIPLFVLATASVVVFQIWRGIPGWAWALLVISLGVALAMLWRGLSFAISVGSSVLTLALVAALVGFTASGNSTATSPPSNPPSTPPAVDLAQCRFDAVTKYMTEQGFTDGQYVIGEARVDKTKPEFTSAGPAAFAANGGIGTRDKLQQAFNSNDPAQVAIVNAQVNKFPGVSRNDLLNAQNWEIVQTTVPATVQGNTGLSDGVVVNAGNRASGAGDAAWVYVDKTSCTVPRSNISSTGIQLASNVTSVAMIRVGCGNPTNNIVPNQPTPTPSTPPTTPPTPTCESVYGPGWTGHYPTACKDPSSDDPQQQGHNRPGGGGVAPPVTTGPSAPAAGNPPAVYTPPAPPAVTHTTPPQVNTSPQLPSVPVPTVDPATQPPNNGVIGNSGNPTNPDPVPGSGGSCNPVFQSC